MTTPSPCLLVTRPPPCVPEGTPRPRLPRLRGRPTPISRVRLTLIGCGLLFTLYASEAVFPDERRQECPGGRELRGRRSPFAPALGAAQEDQRGRARAQTGPTRPPSRLHLRAEPWAENSPERSSRRRQPGGRVTELFSQTARKPLGPRWRLPPPPPPAAACSEAQGGGAAAGAPAPRPPAGLKGVKVPAGLSPGAWPRVSCHQRGASGFVFWLCNPAVLGGS